MIAPGRSLRVRLAALAGAAILAALSLAGAGLVLLFERHVERRLGTELDTYLDQLAAGVRFDAQGALAGGARLADPRFDKVYGGLYWQILDETTGAQRRSRSLWDVALGLPKDEPAIGDIDVHDLVGPREAALLAHERRLIVSAPQGERVLRFVAAVERAEIDALTRAFAVEVAVALILLAALLTGASVLQLQLGLRPLTAVREKVAMIRSGQARRLTIDAPGEIAPLVDEVNALLDAHERSIAKAKERAADLAHGFNTPLTSLLNDARRLRDKGETALAAEIETTARAMRRQIERELARARAAAARGPATKVEIRPVLDGLVRTLARTPQGEHVRIEVETAPGLATAAAEEDLADILGNLLENAVRHAAARVRVAAARDGLAIVLQVEDDGPGVPKHRREQIMDRGVRLDRSGAGSGLGLAIVRDLLEGYGAALTLGVSRLGGLSVMVSLPVAPAATDQAAPPSPIAPEEEK